jgi:hypothetical protein
MTQRFTTSQTFTTGPIWRNPNTEIVVVTLLNEDPNVSQAVTVSVLDWQDTCNPTEFDKFAFLCGKSINPPLPEQCVQPQQINIVPLDDVQPITTPLTFTIPPRQLLTIHAVPPQPTFLPAPIYEVRVTFPPNPIRRVISIHLGSMLRVFHKRGIRYSIISFHLVPSK